MTSSEAVGWARFGNHGGGHRLLDSSGVSEELLREVRWHTDLPPQAATSWAPFFAGYRKGDYYIVQQTSPDFEAQRPGMVETIVAVHTVAGIGEASLSELKRPVRALTGAVENADSDVVPAGVGPCVDRLSTGGTVHWIGEASFARAVESLWDFMGATDRANLVFGLLFSPTSVPYPFKDGSLAIYLVPNELRSRFDDATIIDTERPPAPRATARAVLSGDTTLAEQLGIAEPSLKQWRLLAGIQSYLDRLESLELEETRSCSHILGTLTTAVDDGLHVKKRVVEKLKEVSPNAPFGHISGCRNLPFNRLPGLTPTDLVDLWSKQVFSTPERQADLGAAIKYLDTSAANGFKRTLESSLRSEWLAAVDNVVEYLHAMISSGDQRSFSWLASEARNPKIDSALAAVVGPDSAVWLHEEAHRHGMPKTHAAACPVDEPVEAWEAHLAITGHTAESRSRLASRCGPQQLVEAALHLGDSYMFPLAGAAAMTTPEVLEPARLDNRNWRAVLAAAVKRGADPWIWTEARDAVEPVLSAFLDSENNLIPIVIALSAAEEINLLDFPRRSQVWTAVDEPHRSLFLRRTALAATMRGDTNTAIEPPLIKAICSNANLHAAATLDVHRAVDTLESLAQFCTAGSAIEITKAAALGGSSRRFGRIIATNRWTKAARFLAANTCRQNDRRAAAEECRSLLPWWDRFTLAFDAGGRPTGTDISDGLLDITTRLYPEGPNQRGLWERSGGDPADTPTSGTGREQWAQAIQAIIDGATGTPSMIKLIDTMTDDFPKNSQLKKLRSVL